MLYRERTCDRRDKQCVSRKELCDRKKNKGDRDRGCLTDIEHKRKERYNVSEGKKKTSIVDVCERRTERVVRHTYPLVLSKCRLECERDKELVHACLRERERTSVQERFCAKKFLQMKENKFSLRHHLKKIDDLCESR